MTDLGRVQLLSFPQRLGGSVNLNTIISTKTNLKTILNRITIMALEIPQTTPEAQQAAAEAQAKVVNEPETTAQAPAAEPVVEQKAEPAKTTAPTETAAAPVSPAAPVAATTAAISSTSTLSSLEESGFSGLVVNGMSFDRIRLNNGVFQYGQTSRDIGRSFSALIMQCTSVYVVKADPKDNDSPIFYTYDETGQTLTDGSPADAIYAEWAERGLVPDEKTGRYHTQKYNEVMVTIVGCPQAPELEGQIAVCQIAPASLARFGGYCHIQLSTTGKKPNEYVTEFLVGPTINRDRNSTYNPWDFRRAQ